MCSWHYPAPEEKVNKNTCCWLLRTFAKFAHSPNCSHVGLLSCSSKRGGMPSLRNARVSQREKFMNGTICLWWWLWWYVFICVLMCVFGIQLSCSSKSAVSPIFFFILFYWGESITWSTVMLILLILSVHPHLLEALLVLMLSLSNHAWMCVRDNAQCQGGPWLNLSQVGWGPDEKLRKSLDFSDILSLLCIWLLYRGCTEATMYCGVRLRICQQGYRCVCRTVCVVMINRLQEEEAWGWTWNTWFRDLLW